MHNNPLTVAQMESSGDGPPIINSDEAFEKEEHIQIIKDDL